MNPYRGLKDFQFWKRAVSEVEKFEFAPLVDPKFLIGEEDKIVTAGSCFAQHLARALQQNGFNYYVPEDGSDLSDADRKAKQYGLFSARFGNIYTPAHLRQLLEEAFGDRPAAHERFWERPDGRFVDPYRPNVEPEGYETPEDVAAARLPMLQAVRRMVLDGNIFVFTMGLTEAFRSQVDHRVFPIAPGVSGGAFDPEQHEFINFSVFEILDDMKAVLALIKRHNPQMHVILTVSPVPLIATYETRNVLVSTTYSKSALRVAAEELHKSYSNVQYFPSYEIITGHYTLGSYFEADLREVCPAGVAHVMRVVLKDLVQSREEKVQPLELGLPDDQIEIICDEDAIEQIL